MGKKLEAIACYNDAINYDPKDHFAYFYKGIALMDFGLYEDAIECFNKALSINPNDAEIYLKKGLALD